MLLIAFPKMQGFMEHLNIQVEGQLCGLSIQLSSGHNLMGHGMESPMEFCTQWGVSFSPASPLLS